MGDLFKYSWSGLVIVFGIGLLGWIGYNHLIEMQPEAQGQDPLIPLVFAIGMIATGVWRIRRTAAGSAAVRAAGTARHQDTIGARITCPSCDHSFAGSAGVTFLGFRRFHCPSCGHDTDHPLWPVARVLYWVVLVWFSIQGVRLLGSGDVPLPGLIVVLAAAALVWDRVLVGRLQKGA